ncbi:MAG: DNA-3-methyladenine glycosylase I [Rhodospirillales bacterium]
MTVKAEDGRRRCGWVGTGKPHYEAYHDKEWGVPVHDDQKHFEMLILEGAQAGLNWETILKKREGYRKAFKNFDAARTARMTDKELEVRLQDPAIVRNRLKVFGARKNARAFLEIQKEFGSFDAYVWDFIGGAPRINAWKTTARVPAETKESQALSKDLKKRGMTFVGPTIIYAYMQAAGLVNDHLVSCWRYKPCGG